MRAIAILPLVISLFVIACGSSSNATASDAGGDAPGDAPTPPGEVCSERAPPVDTTVCQGQLSSVSCNSPADRPKTLCRWTVTFPCGLPGEDAGAAVSDGGAAEGGVDAGPDSEPTAERCAELCSAGSNYRDNRCTLSRSDAGSSVVVVCGPPACGA